jgi:hypothetical protein
MPRPESKERRRSPRAAVSCEAKVVSTGGAHFSAVAEDVAREGCRVVAPRPLARGSALRVLLRSGHGEVDLLGTVIWVSPEAPWRLGIAFAPPSIAAAGVFFEGLERLAAADSAP